MDRSSHGMKVQVNSVGAYHGLRNGRKSHRPFAFLPRTLTFSVGLLMVQGQTVWRNLGIVIGISSVLLAIPQFCSDWSRFFAPKLSRIFLLFLRRENTVVQNWGTGSPQNFTLLRGSKFLLRLLPSHVDSSSHPSPFWFIFFPCFNSCWRGLCHLCRKIRGRISKAVLNEWSGKVIVYQLRCISFGFAFAACALKVLKNCQIAHVFVTWPFKLSIWLRRKIELQEWVNQSLLFLNKYDENVSTRHISAIAIHLYSYEPHQSQDETFSYVRPFTCGLYMSTVGAQAPHKWWGKYLI